MHPHQWHTFFLLFKKSSWSFQKPDRVYKAQPEENLQMGRPQCCRGNQSQHSGAIKSHMPSLSFPWGTCLLFLPDKPSAEGKPLNKASELPCLMFHGVPGDGPPWPLCGSAQRMDVSTHSTGEHGSSLQVHQPTWPPACSSIFYPMHINLWLSLIFYDLYLIPLYTKTTTKKQQLLMALTGILLAKNSIHHHVTGLHSPSKNLKQKNKQTKKPAYLLMMLPSWKHFLFLLIYTKDWSNKLKVSWVTWAGSSAVTHKL